jgi:glycosyltransferase involved in cell wall biosynthesis
VDAVVTVCEAQAKLLLDFSFEESFVLKGFAFDYPANKCIEPSPSKKKHENTFYMTCVGTICPRKRQHWLIRAVQYLQSIFPNDNIVVDIVGDLGGEYSDSVNKMIEKQTSIHIHPFSKSVLQYLKRSDLHVSVSSIEAYPLNTLEAKRYRIPVIATDAGGTAEQNVDVLVPVDDFGAFKTKLLEIYMKTKKNKLQHENIPSSFARQEVIFKEGLLTILNKVDENKRMRQKSNMLT